MPNHVEIVDWIAGPNHVSSADKDGYIHYGVECLLFLNNQFVFSGGGDYCTRLWDVNTGEVVKTFRAPSHHEVKCLALSSCKKYLAAGHGSSGGVHLWNVNTGELVWQLKNYMYIESICFSADDATIIANHGYANYLKIDRQSGQLISDTMNDGSVNISFFSEDKKRSYELSNGTLSAFDVNTELQLWSYNKIDQDNLKKVAYCSHLDLLAVFKSKNEIVFIKGGAGEISNEFPFSVKIKFFESSPLCFSTQRPVLLMRTEKPKQVIFYNILTKDVFVNEKVDEKLSKLPPVTCLAYSPDGTKLVFGAKSYQKAPCFSLHLKHNMEVSFYKDLINGNHFLWRAIEANDLKIINQKMKITLKDGYWFAKDLKSDLEKNSLSLAEELAKVYCLYPEDSGSNPSFILNTCLHYFQKKNQQLALDIAIQSLYFGIPSAEKVIHDPWGILIFYFDQACEYLLTQDLSQISIAFTDKMSVYLTRAAKINLELDEDLRSKFLGKLIAKFDLV
jgi:WD40 repeat protein